AHRAAGPRRTPRSVAAASGRSPSIAAARATPAPPTGSWPGAAGAARPRPPPSAGGPAPPSPAPPPGGGYPSPPAVILSPLPAATLADLDALFIIPATETDVVGERILQALEGTVQASHPNHFLHVEPDTGMIRFLDPRTFTPLTLTLDVDP